VYGRQGMSQRNDDTSSDESVIFERDSSDEETSSDESIDENMLYDMNDPQRLPLDEWLKRYTPGKTNR